MNPIKEITKIADKIPLDVLQGFHKCIAEWLSNGGNHDDPYVYRQFEYAKKFIEEG